MKPTWGEGQRQGEMRAGTHLTGHSPSLKEFRVVTQAGQDLMQKPWRNTTYWLVSRPTSLGTVLSRVAGSSFTSSNQENAPTHMPTCDQSDGANSSTALSALKISLTVTLGKLSDFPGPFIYNISEGRGRREVQALKKVSSHASDLPLCAA